MRSRRFTQPACFKLIAPTDGTDGATGRSGNGGGGGGGGGGGTVNCDSYGSSGGGGGGRGCGGSGGKAGRSASGSFAVYLWRLLLPRVLDRHHLVLLTVGIEEVHRGRHMVIVRHVGRHLVLGHFTIRSLRLARHRGGLLLFVVRAFEEHRPGAHGVHPHGYVLLLLRIITIQAVTREFLLAERALEIAHQPHAAANHFVRRCRRRFVVAHLDLGVPRAFEFLEGFMFRTRAWRALPLCGDVSDGERKENRADNGGLGLGFHNI